MSEPKNEPWRLERKVPIAVMVALGLQLVGQLVGFAWWASAQSAKLEHQANRLDAVERSIAAAAPQAITIAKLETKFDGMATNLTEIKDILRRQPPAR